MHLTQPLQQDRRPWSPLDLLPGERHRAIFLLLLATAVYLPILGNGLVWDADLLLRHDPRLKDLRHAFDYFHQGLWGFDANRAVDYYRPLVGLLHTIEYALFGLAPLGYNAVNLLLNAGVCLLAYQLLGRLLPRDHAFWGAALYASLPVRAEVTYWTYSDSHLLVAVFILLAVIRFLDGKPASSLLFFVLALLSQEAAVVFPGIVLVAAFCRRELKRRAGFLCACFATAGLYLAGRTLLLGPAFLKKAAANDPQTILYLLAKYLKILFLQDAAITIYAREPRTLAEFWPYVVAGALLLGGIVALAALALRHDRLRLFWLAWFLLLMLPTFLIGKTGAYYMAEKPLFLSGLGIVALLAGVIRPANRLVIAVACLVIVANSALTFAEGKYWRSTESYLEKVLEFDDRFVLGLAGAGDAYFARGDYDNALRHYRRIVAINPWHLGAINSIRRIEQLRQGQPAAAPPP
ncbi:MAG: hypothetical protein FDZ69_10540 [Deltaproteobacteria bacterium]|nr:MAG: hypothetical protein FDZ69_10540 [Deltaproteobacteria bacterium]